MDIPIQLDLENLKTHGGTTDPSVHDPLTVSKGQDPSAKEPATEPSKVHPNKFKSQSKSRSKLLNVLPPTDPIFHPDPSNASPLDQPRLESQSSDSLVTTLRELSSKDDSKPEKDTKRLLLLKTGLSNSGSILPLTLSSKLGPKGSGISTNGSRTGSVNPNSSLRLIPNGNSHPNVQNGQISGQISAQISGQTAAQNGSNVSNSLTNGNVTHASNLPVSGRKRLNSRSQGTASPVELPEKRIQMQYLVTLVPLNDTFITKNLLVPYFPDTLKLGRPAGSKVKPEINNGYFDSRVLSRNHALLYIDPVNSKLMIKDLGSSNGTFVNEEKIGQEAVELSIGDIIYLGFNIEVDTSHKKILAKVENINVLPMKLKYLMNLGGGSSSYGTTINGLGSVNGSNNVNSPEYKHYNFVQLIFAASKASNLTKPQPDVVLLSLYINSNSNDQDKMSFDRALFGDINPSLDANLLGLGSKSGCGIFNNAQVTNSSQLENAIEMLQTCLVTVKQQNSTLKLLELFATNYQTKVDELNKEYIDKQYETKINNFKDQVAEKLHSISRLNAEHAKYRKNSSIEIQHLEDEVGRLRQELALVTQRLTEEEDARNQSTSSVYLIEEKPVFTPPVSDEEGDYHDQSVDRSGFPLISQSLDTRLLEILVESESAIQSSTELNGRLNPIASTSGIGSLEVESEAVENRNGTRDVEEATLEPRSSTPADIFEQRLQEKVQRVIQSEAQTDLVYNESQEENQKKELDGEEERKGKEKNEGNRSEDEAEPESDSVKYDEGRSEESNDTVMSKTGLTNYNESKKIMQATTGLVLLLLMAIFIISRNKAPLSDGVLL